MQSYRQSARASKGAAPRDFFRVGQKKGLDLTQATSVVIDCGTAFTRSGFGGDSTPISTIATVVGKPRTTFQNQNKVTDSADVFVGAGVYKRSAQLSIKYPLENRVITNFEDMTHLISHIYTSELCIAPEKHPLVMTIQPQTPEENKSKLLEIIMETFKIPAFYPASPAAMALYSAGVTSGIVVDSGEAGTNVMPVYECFSMPYFSEKLDMGGKHVNDALRKNLISKGHHLSPAFERDVLRDVKEQLCFVCSDLDEQKQSTEDITKGFSLPDGAEISVSNERYLSPEVLFKPSLLGIEGTGTSQMIANVMAKLDDDVKEQICSTILLTGGSTLFNGYEQRISSDLQRMVNGISYDIVAQPSRQISSWVGGSIIASVSTFSHLWISKQEYEEEGPSIFAVKSY